MGYVYENLHVQEGLTWPTIKWAIRTFDDNNWHPVTWISHSLDCQMFGIDPAGHHIMNAMWHSVDVVVLFWVLLLATGYIGRSFMVAALFAFHPINVESVAWMSERKTLLSTLFFLLALGAYRWYARRPGVWRYMVMAGLFALGLMSKPQIITLPGVLLLWDYWPLQRMFSDRTAGGKRTEETPFPPKRLFWLIKEKIPLLALCAASALATMKAQRVGRPQYWQYSTWIRSGNAIVAYVRYIGKALWPSKLAVMYLHPGDSLRVWQVALAGLVLLAITALVIAGRRYRYLPVGWFWFLGTLVPTIGFIQVGRQALADRYAYQSFIGLFILICWGVADWAQKQKLPKALLPTASIAVLVTLMVVTHRQIDVWKDNLTLWTHAMQVTKDNWMAEDMVAGILFNTGHREEAMRYYRSTAAINPHWKASPRKWSSWATKSSVPAARWSPNFLRWPGWRIAAFRMMPRNCASRSPQCEKRFRRGAGAIPRARTDLPCHAHRPAPRRFTIAAQRKSRRAIRQRGPETHSGHRVENGAGGIAHRHSRQRTDPAD